MKQRGHFLLLLFPFLFLCLFFLLSSGMSEVRDDPITEEISGKRMVTPTENPSL